MSEYLTEAEAARKRRVRTAFWRGLKRGVLIGIGWRRG